MNIMPSWYIGLIGLTLTHCRATCTDWACPNIDLGSSLLSFQLQHTAGEPQNVLSVLMNGSTEHALDPSFTVAESDLLIFAWAFQGTAPDTRNTITAILRPELCIQRLSKSGGALEVTLHCSQPDGEVTYDKGPYPLTADHIRAVVAPYGLQWQTAFQFDLGQLGWDLSTIPPNDKIVGITVNVTTAFLGDERAPIDPSTTFIFHLMNGDAPFGPGDELWVPMQNIHTVGSTTTEIGAGGFVWKSNAHLDLLPYTPIFEEDPQYRIMTEATAPVTIVTHVDAVTILQDLSPAELASQYAENTFLERTEAVGPYTAYYGFVAVRQEGQTGPFIFGISHAYGPGTLNSDNKITWYFTNDAEGHFTRTEIGLTQPVTAPNTPFEVSAPEWLIVGDIDAGNDSPSIIAAVDMYPKDQLVPTYNDYVETEPYECRHRDLVAFKFKTFGRIGEDAETLKVVLWGSQGTPTDTNNDRMWTLIPVNVIGENAIRKDVVGPIELALDTHAPDYPFNNGGLLLTVSKDAIAPYNYLKLTVYLDDPSVFDEGQYIEITANAREL